MPPAGRAYLSPLILPRPLSKKPNLLSEALLRVEHFRFSNDRKLSKASVVSSLMRDYVVVLSYWVKLSCQMPRYNLCLWLPICVESHNSGPAIFLAKSMSGALTQSMLITKIIESFQVAKYLSYKEIGQLHRKSLDSKLNALRPAPSFEVGAEVSLD